MSHRDSILTRMPLNKTSPFKVIWYVSHNSSPYHNATKWMEKVLIEKITSAQFMMYPSIHRAWRFINIFRTCRWYLHVVKLVKGTHSHSPSLESTLLLSSHLCLHLPWGLFPQADVISILYLVGIVPSVLNALLVLMRIRSPTPLKMQFSWTSSDFTFVRSHCSRQCPVPKHFQFLSHS
jgi:hypothetical protein